ncbi:RodZ domain-containing protein [Roseovarius ramblicola]|uniref:RodZ domain-containing protein n=1 Tax=Roseovarius ramblicola TaxID=2022336 RepID=A0ABV5HYV0_9RHOB
MIGRRRTLETTIEEADIRGFDAYDLRLGDLMRGERATLGKSLLDVERELRIRANYVAAIENADPSIFDTPGFIPGYVRSYARYLGMDPDRAFAAFCAESGFSIAHGMSEQASSRYRPERKLAPRARPAAGDALAGKGTPFAPVRESVFSRIEPGAIGSALVLVALIGAIGYGGWSVLRQVQQVRLAPVENTPLVLADLDPLEQAGSADTARAGFVAPREDRLSRLYRPKALDVPVMVARDAPISMLDPREVGTLSSPAPPEAGRTADRDSAIARAILEAQQASDETPAVPQVVEGARDKVRVVAVRPAWVRVRAADGSVIFEGIMNAGDTYEVPGTEEPPTLRVGESGAVYFAVNGQHYGPAGPRGAVTADLSLTPDALTGRYALADPGADDDLQSVVAELSQEPQQ